MTSHNNYDLRLHINIQLNKLQRIQQLLADDVPNVNVNETDTLLRTPLHLAFQHSFRNIEIINVLLNHRLINVNVKNGDGETPLDLAIKYQYDTDVILNLLKLGAKINENFMVNNLPLYFKGNLYKNTIILAHLVQHKFNINAKNTDNKTLLDLSFENGNQSLIRALLKYTNYLYVSCNFDGLTILHAITIYNYANILQEIVTRKFKLDIVNLINLKDKQGNTALHYCKTKLICRLLLKCKPNINLQNLKGKTPIHYHFKHELKTYDPCNLVDNNPLTYLMLRNQAYLDYDNDKKILLKIFKFYQYHTKISKYLAYCLIVFNQMDLLDIMDDCRDSNRHRAALIEYEKYFIEFHKMKMHKLYPFNMTLFDIYFNPKNYYQRKNVNSVIATATDAASNSLASIANTDTDDSPTPTTSTNNTMDVNVIRATNNNGLVINWNKCDFKKFVNKTNFPNYYFELVNRIKSMAPNYYF